MRANDLDQEERCEKMNLAAEIIFVADFISVHATNYLLVRHKFDHIHIAVYSA